MTPPPAAPPPQASLQSLDPPRGEARGPVGKTPDAYHHGDLRSALLVAARDALKTAPAETVTLKSLALRLGVSQPAPYRHFASREALLAAVAADGFVRFREALEAAVRTGPAAGRFERACAAYLAFGRENVGVYRLMFASPIALGADRAGPLAEAAGAAFALLETSLGAPASAGPAPGPLVLWSALHGIAMLQADGLLSGPAEISEAALLADLAERFRADVAG